MVMRRREDSVMECINRQYVNFKANMQSMHKDKMSRKERVLDLYERKVHVST